MVRYLKRAPSRRNWKVVTYGIAYHEDVTSRLYGVQPTRSPKGWNETRALRAAIESIRMGGTHEIGSRGGRRLVRGVEGERRDVWVSEQQPRPEGAALASWTDRKPGSLASFPTLTVYEGGIIGIVAPNYDDSPTVAWVSNAKLAKDLLRAIAVCPAPLPLITTTNIRERTTRLKIEADHPRFTAYTAARDARIEAPDPRFSSPGYIVLPTSEYRRIKATVDEAAEYTQQ